MRRARERRDVVVEFKSPPTLRHRRRKLNKTHEHRSNNKTTTDFSAFPGHFNSCWSHSYGKRLRNTPNNTHTHLQWRLGHMGQHSQHRRHGVERVQR